MTVRDVDAVSEICEMVVAGGDVALERKDAAKSRLINEMKIEIGSDNAIWDRLWASMARLKRMGCKDEYRKKWWITIRPIILLIHLLFRVCNFFNMLYVLKIKPSSTLKIKKIKIPFV